MPRGRLEGIGAQRGKSWFMKLPEEAVEGSGGIGKGLFLLDFHLKLPVMRATADRWSPQLQVHMEGAPLARGGPPRPQGGADGHPPAAQGSPPSPHPTVASGSRATTASHPSTIFPEPASTPPAPPLLGEHPMGGAEAAVGGAGGGRL